MAADSPPPLCRMAILEYRVDMKTRPLGKTGLQLTTIGLGTWAIGGGDWEFGWGPQDDEQSIRTIHRALDLGINWIDTAAVYGLGHCEEVVGRALRGLSQRPLIATKCERRWDDQGRIVDAAEAGQRPGRTRGQPAAAGRRRDRPVPNPLAATRRGYRGSLGDDRRTDPRGESALRRREQLQRRPTPPHPAAAPGRFAAAAVQHAGARRRGRVAAVLRANTGSASSSTVPMQKGLLTGKVTRDWVAGLPADDHRRSDPQFQEPRLSANLALVEGLRQIAAKHGKTVAHLAIAWVLRRPEVTAAIVGARHPGQIEQTTAGADWDLAEEDVAAIEDLLQRRHSR